MQFAPCKGRHVYKESADFARKFWIVVTKGLPG